MKAISNITSTIFSLVFLVACNNAPYEIETKEFNGVLQQHFKMKIESPKAVYLLVPVSQCKNCIFLDAKDLDSSLNTNLYLLNGLDTAHFKNFKHQIPDRYDKVMKLSFLHYKNQIVLTENGRIQSIFPLTNFSSQMDSLKREFISAR